MLCATFQDYNFPEISFRQLLLNVNYHFYRIRVHQLNQILQILKIER